jgi:membrane protein required for colicin V production
MNGLNAFISTLPPPRLTWFDLAALAILLLFALQGYRRGALGWIGTIGASILALVGAFVLAPAVAQLLAGRSQLGVLVTERIAFIVLLIALRFLLGLAMRELMGSVRTVLWALPPLGFIDRMLGVVPSLLLGTLLVVLVLVISMALPVNQRLHDAARDSYLGQVAVTETNRVTLYLPSGGLMAAPDRILDLERLLAALQSFQNFGKTS